MAKKIDFTAADWRRFRAAAEALPAGPGWLGRTRRRANPMAALPAPGSPQAATTTKEQDRPRDESWAVSGDLSTEYSVGCDSTEYSVSFQAGSRQAGPLDPR